jgi:hypothetical protein
VTLPGQRPAAEAPPAIAGAQPSDIEVWQLLGRADVILRGVLQSQDRAERRLWEERARVWLDNVGQAWVQSQRRSW